MYCLLESWDAGAIDLRSERRYTEAYQVYEMMSAVWPDEKQVEELDQLMKRWIKARDEREKLS